MWSPSRKLPGSCAGVPASLLHTAVITTAAKDVTDPLTGAIPELLLFHACLPQGQGILLNHTCLAFALASAGIASTCAPHRMPVLHKQLLPQMITHDVVVSTA